MVITRRNFIIAFRSPGIFGVPDGPFSNGVVHADGGRVASGYVPARSTGAGWVVSTFRNNQ